MAHSQTDLINVLSTYSEPVSRVEIKKALEDRIPDRTLRRLLAKLVKDGSVVVVGQSRSRRYQLLPNKAVLLIAEAGAPQQTAHTFFSAASLQIIQKVQRPIFQRDPCSYNESWLKSYLPNQTYYLSAAQRQTLSQNSVLLLEDKSAGTYTRKIFNRLLIDLSYNSSRLEGNTYSLLETEKLVIEGVKVPDKLDAEQVMILNHKEAIRYLIEGINRINVDVDAIRTMHYLLAEGLVPAQNVGQIRDEGVRITLTTYAPMEGHQRLSNFLELIAATAAKIMDPFEQSFFLLVHIAYLQAFIDINKRTARLCANIPLVRNNLIPLSFNDIDKEDYISAVIATYEYNEVGPLAELYVWSYLRSCKHYQVIGDTIGIDVINVRYRQPRRQLIALIIHEKVIGQDMQKLIRAFAKENIPAADCNEFIEDVLNELANLEKFKIAGMGLSEQEFLEWKAKGG